MENIREVEPTSAMPTELVEAVEATPVADLVKPKPKRKPAAKKVANRLPEDCFYLDPKKLNDTEKNALIKFMQEQLVITAEKLENLQNNTQGAFEQTRILKIENDSIKKEAQVKINLMKQNISLMYQNTLMITMED